MGRRRAAVAHEKDGGRAQPTQVQEAYSSQRIHRRSRRPIIPFHSVCHAQVATTVHAQLLTGHDLTHATLVFLTDTNLSYENVAPETNRAANKKQTH